MRKWLRNFAPWGLAALLFGLGLGTAGSLRQTAQAYSSSYDDLRIFAEVMSLIQNYYVEEKTSKDLTVGAIKGLLRTLDPHSSYMDVDSYQNRRQETEGKFGGLGIEITVMDDYVTVVSPMEDTPAERAGLKAGDQIIKIEGQSTKNMDIHDAVKLLRGEVGSRVNVTIYRDSNNSTFEKSIARDIIHVKSVKYDMIDEEIGFIRISSFSQETTREVKAAMADLRGRGYRRLIVDLRNNPGGLLKQAVEVCDLFIDNGHTIVSTRGRASDQNTKFISTNRNAETNIPMVLVINAGSASASEIMAGAMQDLKRAKIVGERSFGKGSVQTIRQLSDGSGLGLTTARYYTPSGRMIHGIGIEPDINVKLELKDDNGDEIDLPEPFREKDLMNRFKGKTDPDDDVVEHGDSKKDKATAKPVKIKKRTSKERKEDLAKRRKLFDLERDNQLLKAIEVVKSLDRPRISQLH